MNKPVVTLEIPLDKVGKLQDKDDAVTFSGYRGQRRTIYVVVEDGEEAVVEAVFIHDPNYYGPYATDPSGVTIAPWVPTRQEAEAK